MRSGIIRAAGWRRELVGCSAVTGSRCFKAPRWQRGRKLLAETDQFAQGAQGPPDADIVTTNKALLR
jgi:hypothetical protein